MIDSQREPRTRALASRGAAHAPRPGRRGVGSSGLGPRWWRASWCRPGGGAGGSFRGGEPLRSRKAPALSHP